MAALSVHETCFDSIQSVLRGLAGIATLGVTADWVVVRVTPGAFGTLSYPCITLSLEGADELAVATNTRFDPSYAVAVAYHDRATVQDVEVLPRVLYFKQLIQQAFFDQRLPDVPEVYRCDVRPSLPWDEQLGQYQYVLDSQTVVCQARLPKVR